MTNPARRALNRRMKTAPRLDGASADALAGPGVVVLDGWLGHDAAVSLRRDLELMHAGGLFRPARIGSGPRRRRMPSVRRDEICWLDPRAPFAATDGAEGVRPPPSAAPLFAALEELRLELNALCFLGLQGFECHGARYERGAFYRAHVDTFVGDPRRVISFAYFLNEAWRAGDGGCLRVHGEPRRDIEPLLDRLALFRAGDVLHEVRPVRRGPRFTLTGWMRRDDGVRP